MGRGIALGFVLGLVACSPAGGISTGGSAGTGDPPELCAALGASDATLVRGSVVTRCQQVDGEPRCQAIVTGERQGATLIEDARSARPASGGLLLVHRADFRLELVRPDGAPARPLAPWADDPEVDLETGEIVYLAPLEGHDSAGLGAPTRVVSFDPATGLTTVLSEDPMAALPIPIPGSDDVLVVSTATGTAAVWRVGASTEPTLLTNRVGSAQGMTAVPGSDWAWSDDGARLFFARDGVVHELTLDTGEVRSLGPGRHLRSRDGSVVVSRDGSCGRIFDDGRGA